MTRLPAGGDGDAVVFSARRPGHPGPVSGEWPRTAADARRVQEALRARVHPAGRPRRVRLVAGADLAYRRDGRWAWAAVVVMTPADGQLVEVATVAGVPGFPYVPGFLTFREGPLLLAAFARLRARPDLYLFDGHELAHPRRFGLACHLGVLLDLPAVGCAKSLLIGRCDPPGPERGASTPIRVDDQTVGAAVTTRAGTRPVFVSPGHKIGLDAAVAWVLRCARFRVPEPIRRAEQVVNRLKGGAS